jgi:hypothetical protein
VTAGNVKLSWEVVAQAGVKVDCYDLFRCAKATCPGPPKIAACITATSYTDQPSKGKHWYEVKAEDTISGKKVVTADSNIEEATVN